MNIVKKELEKIEKATADLENQKEALIQKVNAKVSLLKDRSSVNASDEQSIAKLKKDIRTLKIKFASLETTVQQYKKELALV